MYPAINKTLAQTRYSLTRRPGRQVRHIVVHYTACDAPATNFCKAFSKPNCNASADYFIGKDGEIAQFNADPRNCYSWHCGDGHGNYGITNAASIGIEVVSTGEDFNAKQKVALRDLTRALMADYGVTADRVVRHYDASRKQCPMPYSGSAQKDAKWRELHAYITNGQPTESEEPDMQLTDKVTRPDGKTPTINDVLGYMDERLERIEARLKDASDHGSGADTGAAPLDRIAWLDQKLNLIMDELDIPRI